MIMSEITNGHTNGFGSDDDVSDLSSEEGEEGEEEEEECEEERNGGVAASRVNGQSTEFDDDIDEDEKVENAPANDDDDLDDDEGAQDEDSDSDSAPEDISFKTGKDDFQQKSQLQQKQIEKSLTAAKGEV